MTFCKKNIYIKILKYFYIHLDRMHISFTVTIRRKPTNSNGLNLESQAHSKHETQTS